MVEPPVDFTVQTDASLQGWGGVRPPTSQRQLESRTEAPPHQCVGGKSYQTSRTRAVLLSHSNPYPDSDGRYYRSGVHKPPGRNQISAVELGSNQAMEMVSRRRIYISYTHTRCAECPDRLPVQNVTRSNDVVCQESEVQRSSTSPRLLTRRGSVCLQNQLQAKQICDVESRLSGMGDRRSTFFHGQN